MQTPLIGALAVAYYLVFHYYRHCTIWVLLSSICLHISDSGSNESLLRYISPLFILLHYYALSVQSEQLELAAITGALGLALITSPAFKNEVVLPEDARTPTVTTEISAAAVVPPTSTVDRRVEIVTPSQPQPKTNAITPGKSILKTVRPKKTVETTSTTPASTGKKAPGRRKSAGGVNGMDSDVLDALTSSASTPAEEEAPATSTKTNKRRTSTSSRTSSGEDLLAQARAAARAQEEALASQAAAAVAATGKRGAKRRAPMAEEEIGTNARAAVAAVQAMEVDNDDEEEEAVVPSPKKLRTTRKRSAKMDL